MNQGTTPQSDRRPGVGQAPEQSSEGCRYAPGHTEISGVLGGEKEARDRINWWYF